MHLWPALFLLIGGSEAIRNCDVWAGRNCNMYGAGYGMCCGPYGYTYLYCDDQSLTWIKKYCILGDHCDTNWEGWNLVNLCTQ